MIWRSGNQQKESGEQKERQQFPGAQFHLDVEICYVFQRAAAILWEWMRLCQRVCVPRLPRTWAGRAARRAQRPAQRRRRLSDGCALHLGDFSRNVYVNDCACPPFGE